MPAEDLSLWRLLEGLTGEHGVILLLLIACSNLLKQNRALLAKYDDQVQTYRELLFYTLRHPPSS